MVNDNDELLKRLNAMMGLKTGYSLEDKKEFYVVRESLIRNKLPFDNFDTNLRTLVIENKINDCYDYKPSINKINAPDGETLIHELFHMASSRERGREGIGSMLDDGFGCSLNEGVTDYCTSKTKKNYFIRYPFEVQLFKIISKVYNPRELLYQHFSGNPDRVYDSFGLDKVIIYLPDVFFRTWQI